MKRKLFWIALVAFTLYPFTMKADNLGKEAVTVLRKTVSIEAQGLEQAVGIMVRPDELSALNLTPFYAKIIVNDEPVCVLWVGDYARFKLGFNTLRAVGIPMLFTSLFYDDTSCTDAHYLGATQWQVMLGTTATRLSHVIRTSDIERVDGGHYNPYSMPPMMVYKDGPYQDSTVHIHSDGHNAATVVALLNNTQGAMEVIVGGKRTTTVSTGRMFFKVFENYSQTQVDQKVIDLIFWKGAALWRNVQEQVTVPTAHIQFLYRIYSQDFLPPLH